MCRGTTRRPGSVSTVEKDVERALPDRNLRLEQMQQATFGSRADPGYPEAVDHLDEVVLSQPRSRVR